MTTGNVYCCERQSSDRYGRRSSPPFYFGMRAGDDAISLAICFVCAKNDNPVLKRTATQVLFLNWNDGAHNWVPLKDPTDSTPVELAEFAVANRIDKEPTEAQSNHLQVMEALLIRRHASLEYVFSNIEQGLVLRYQVCRYHSGNDSRGHFNCFPVFKKSSVIEGHNVTMNLTRKGWPNGFP